MPNTLRPRRPILALAAPAIIATAGSLSACTSAHSGSPVAQQSPKTQQSPQASPSPQASQSPASPAPTTQSQPGPGAEHLDPARFSMVTVSVDLTGVDLKVHKGFRSRAVIDRLTRMVNSLPEAKSARTSCPSAEFTYRLSFRVKGTEPDTTVTGSDSCPTEKFSVDGKPQRPLMDRPGALDAAVRSLLKLKISTSGF
jgi:hypothetical protein